MSKDKNLEKLVELAKTLKELSNNYIVSPPKEVMDNIYALNKVIAQEIAEYDNLSKENKVAYHETSKILKDIASKASKPTKSIKKTKAK